MKRRVMQKTLAERQKQIDAQRAKAQEIAKKAFETEEISRANKAYIDAFFFGYDKRRRYVEKLSKKLV